MKRLKLSFVFALLVLVMVACSSSGPAPINEFPEDEMITPILTLDANCDLSTIKTWRSGTLSDGSKYEIYRPSSLLWFFISPKLLFVFSHGYFDPYYPEEPVLPNVYASEHDALICSLVQSGAAVAWTSYANNGYAVKSGYDSTEELRQLAASAVGARYAYLIGHSQGGTVATMIAERLGSFDASLSLCGPIGGWPVQAQYVGHVRVLFDAYLNSFSATSTTYNGITYYDGVIPTTSVPGSLGFQPATHVPDDPALIPWTGHYNGSYGGNSPIDARIRAAIEASSDSRQAARDMAAEPYIRLPYSNDDQLARSIVDALYFSVRGTNQTMAITGGSPFGNPDSVYTTTSAIRYSPTSNASRQYIRDYYETTGDLRGRLLALHTVHDPVVPFSHQAYYQDKVTASGRSDLFARQYVRRYGHCVFNDDEIINGLNALRDWRERGIYPENKSDVTVPKADEETIPSPFDINDLAQFAVLEPGPNELSVMVSSGGTVTSNPERISCIGSTCSAYFGAGTQVTLTASPINGYTFSGWSGACLGSSNPCTVTLDNDKAVAASFTSTATTYTLSTSVNPAGSGSVSGGGNYASGMDVTVTATADTGYTFSGWSGDLTGNTNPDTIIMNSDKSVTAHFTQNQYTLSVTTSGQGSVTRIPDKDTYTHGTPVTLTANPAGDWSFSKWEDDCAFATSQTCELIMDGNKSVTAIFSEDSPPPAGSKVLTVLLSGTGSGTVTSTPAGINCGNTCSASFAHGTEVTLSVSSPGHSTFTGWNGACSGTGSTCTVTMDAAKTVTAEFTRVRGR